MLKTGISVYKHSVQEPSSDWLLAHIKGQNKADNELVVIQSVLHEDVLHVKSPVLAIYLTHNCCCLQKDCREE